MNPIPYSPAVESIPPGEVDDTESLVNTLSGIAETTLKHGGRPLRGVHAKSHALLEATLEIAPGLPQELAQGIFARPRSNPVVMRFSTIPGDLLDDSVSTPRGVAIKVFDIDGERLPGSEGMRTQDFVFVNGPVFGAPTLRSFGKNLKLVAATTDRAQWLKKLFSTFMRGLQTVIIAATGKPNATIATLGGQPAVHILGETFFSQTAFRYGEYVAKFRLVPSSRELLALERRKIGLIARPNALRDACNETMARQPAAWNLQVQLRTDERLMPVEDASKEWPQELSAFVTVARLTARPQTAWSEVRAKVVDDEMSFSTWLGITAHQPLGAINRARKRAYAAGKKFREDHGLRQSDSLKLPG